MNEKFNEIIQFAISREEEAVAFYQNLQQMVEFKAKNELLRGLEQMEKGHITVLENLRKNILENPGISVPDVADLKISDYLVEVKPTSDMSYQDIIITAMKREEKAHKLYIDLAEKADDEAKQLFLRIAAEEAKHKLHFEKIYDEEILKDN